MASVQRDYSHQLSSGIESNVVKYKSSKMFENMTTNQMLMWGAVIVVVIIVIFWFMGNNGESMTASAGINDQAYFGEGYRSRDSVLDLFDPEQRSDVPENKGLYSRLASMAYTGNTLTDLLEREGKIALLNELKCRDPSYYMGRYGQYRPGAASEAWGWLRGEARADGPGGVVISPQALAQMSKEEAKKIDVGGGMAPENFRKERFSEGELTAAAAGY